MDDAIEGSFVEGRDIEEDLDVEQDGVLYVDFEGDGDNFPIYDELTDGSRNALIKLLEPTLRRLLGNIIEQIRR